MVHKKDERAPVEPLLTTKDLTQLFRVSGRTIARWSLSGALPAHLMIGGTKRWRASDIRGLLERGPAKKVAPKL